MASLLTDMAITVKGNEKMVGMVHRLFQAFVNVKYSYYLGSCYSDQNTLFMNDVDGLNENEIATIIAAVKEALEKNNFEETCFEVNCDLNFDYGSHSLLEIESDQNGIFVRQCDYNAESSEEDFDEDYDEDEEVDDEFEDGLDAEERAEKSAREELRSAPKVPLEKAFKITDKNLKNLLKEAKTEIESIIECMREEK